MIYTFYSYKGGVGRSMALVNVAEWLYQQGLRVAMIDWDLEAPGLENFFYRSEHASERAEQELDQIRSQLGLIDLLLTYKRQFPHLPLEPLQANSTTAAVASQPAGGTNPLPALADGDDQEMLLSVLQEHLPSITCALYPIHEPDSSGQGGALWLLPAGWRAGDRFAAYAQAVQSFDWADFYARFYGEAFFEWLRRQLFADGLADVVLIDSRTGVTEMGGVCTRQLADVVVSFCAPNLQNLEGVVKMAKSFQRREILHARKNRSLEVVIVPTRLDNSEIADRNRFEKEFCRKADPFAPEALKAANRAFWDLRIPYVPKYAYAETLVIGATDRAEELEAAYKNLAVHLALLAPGGSRLRQGLAADVQRIVGPRFPRVYIAYASDGASLVGDLRQRLEAADITAWPDVAGIAATGDVWQQVTGALDQSKFMLLVMTPDALRSETLRRAWRYARREGVCVYPIVKGALDSGLVASLPRWMRETPAHDLDRDWDKLVHTLRGSCQATRVPLMAPLLPPVFVVRPDLLDQLRDSFLDADHKNPMAIPVALRGPGGSGKTAVAAALCHDEAVIEAFDDGILWVTLGEKPNVKEELAKLYTALTGEPRNFVDVEEAASHLANKLTGKRCLIVIDDAWSAEHLRPFLYSGSNCACLITTRDSHIVSGMKQIRIGQMTAAEGAQVLTAQMDVPPDDPRFFQLAQRLGEWPLMLELAGAALRQRVDRGDTLDGALEYLNRALDKRGVVAFDLRNATERNQAIAKTIAISLEQLSDEERALYLELAMFPQGADIPLAAVSELWGMDDFDTEELVQHLSDLSLLKFDLQAATVNLYDVIRAYIADQLSERASLNARLVETWGDLYHLPHQYAWRHVAYHLVEAGQHAELRRLLLDFTWLQAKLVATDVNALIADYDLLRSDKVLRQIRSAIRLSVHVLVQDKTQLAGQLLGRLLSRQVPEIEALLDQAMRWNGAPWIRPLTRSLTSPDGLLRCTLKGHTDQVTAVAAIPGAQRAISSSSDRTLDVWDLETGAELFTLRGHADQVTAVAVTLDGQRCISASSDRTLKVWDLERRAELLTLTGHTDQVTGVAVTPGGRRCVSASNDRSVKVWSIERGTELLTLTGHTSQVNDVAVTPDAKRVLSCSCDTTVKVWDLDRGTELRTLAGHTAEVNDVAVTPDGRRCVSASNDRTLKVWDLEQGKELFTLSGHDDQVTAVIVTPDGKAAVSASWDTTVKVWDLEHGKELLTFRGHAKGLTGVAVTPDGRQVISASSDQTLKVWNLERELELPSRHEPPRGVTSIAVMPDGQQIIYASNDTTLKVLDLTSGAELRTLQGHIGAMRHMVLSADGRRGVCTAADQTLIVWDLERGTELHTLRGHAKPITGVAITPDGQRILSASDDATIKVWDLASGTELRTLEGHSEGINAVAAMPDGRRCVSASGDRTFKVWDLTKGTELLSFAGHSDQITALAVTPDGQRCISASRDWALNVWDLESGTSCLTLAGHTDQVTAVAVTPDGRHAVSTSSDTTLKVWDLEHGTAVASFSADSPLWTCAVAPNGVTIVAGGALGRVHVLQLEGV